MTLFSSFDISASALTAERLRMDVISNNLANANTTRTPEGGPFRRQVVLFAPRGEARKFVPKGRMSLSTARPSVVGEGVRVVAIQDDDSPPKMVYDPSHPDADENGMVAMPNVDVVREMVDLISAARAYEANVTTINTLKNMALKALEIGRG